MRQIKWWDCVNEWRRVTVGFGKSTQGEKKARSNSAWRVIVKHVVPKFMKSLSKHMEIFVMISYLSVRWSVLFLYFMTVDRRIILRWKLKEWFMESIYLAHDRVLWNFFEHGDVPWWSIKACAFCDYLTFLNSCLMKLLTFTIYLTLIVLMWRIGWAHNNARN